ncbi:MAG TPA: class I SAM-dependent methyltransferase [Candidatus Eisenbacteria bacterium]|nr:class I SAM-dependent methyltransferase [Candidatus Eisenbacteria bacterium]
MSSTWVFDQSHYDALNAAREETIRRILPDLMQRMNLKTALDLGCGLGHYANVLHSQGFDVLAVDGREENVIEAKRRYPDLRFQIADAQDPSLADLGKFDLVFCFGLLYHLENPFSVVRSISALASKLVLIEGIVYPSPEPVMVLMDENTGVDQGLNFMAFYPSETCLIKMLRRAGFAHCHNPSRMPAHPEYHKGANGFRRRTVVAAAKEAIESSLLSTWADPSPEFSPWSMMPLYPAHRRFTRLYGAVDRLFVDLKRRADRH